MTLSTLLDGTEYKLEYAIVPLHAADEKVLIGDPLRDVARVILEPDQAIVEPLSGPEYVRQIVSETSELECALVGVRQDFRGELRTLIEGYRPEGKEKAPVEMKIILKDETPINRRPRRLAPKEMKEVDQQVNEWLEEGIIVPSHSEFASAVVVARKKDGSARLCVDYTPLNKVIVKERTPMPLVEDVLDSLEEAKFYSTVDSKNGFFHVDVAEDSRKYTAFVTPTGQYEFTKVPFGLSTSPAVFTRFILYVFQISCAEK